MLAYVLSSADLSVKDILNFEDYDFHTDIEFAEKSYIQVPRKPDLNIDDFVVCKSENEVVFIGICGDYSSNSGGNAYKIILKQKENLFDREMIAGSRMDQMNDPAVGIEGCVASMIDAGWAQNTDPLYLRSYMTVQVLTRTTTALALSSIVTADGGVFNLKTFLGNILELYRIRVGFNFSVQGALAITVGQDSAPTVNMNALDSDISSYKETLSVDALAKLNVRWGIVSGGEITGYTVRSYYLRTDRTVTMDVSDPDRVTGKVRSIYMESDDAVKVDEAAYNEFKSNSYAHKIEFQLRKASKIYDHEAFYIGRPCAVRTKTGIQTTLVTGRELSNSTAFVSIVFGKLKVTLLEKIRGDRT